MRIIQTKNGFIRLKNSIYADNLFVGVLGLSISSKLINIETDCLIKVEGNIIKLKSGKYTTDELPTQNC